jgi:hypothetical protein
MAGMRTKTKETPEVCHALLQDPVFFVFLQRIDEAFAADARFPS